MKIKISYIFASIISVGIFIYFGVGFYLASSILKINPNCGLHQDALPSTWSTFVDHHEYRILERSQLRKNFPYKNYHMSQWQEVFFSSKDEKIKISGWLFNYFKDRPIVIVVHGIFPNGKCKPESNLIASLLLKNNINALTIDLRNYGDSSKVSKYENLGLSEYKDVLGAFDFLKKLGFKEYQIGLHGISLGGTSVIFAAEKQKEEGKRLCIDLMQEIREIEGVSGIHVMAYRQEEFVAEIVHDSGVLRDRHPWRRELNPGDHAAFELAEKHAATIAATDT